MKHYRESLIAHLEEEIRMLRETDIPIRELYRRKDYHYKRDCYKLQEQISLLSQQISDLAIREPICALSEKNEKDSRVMKFLTGLPTKIKQERKYLDRHINGADKLTITDPYFFSWSRPNKIFDKENKYTDFILNLIPASVEKLEIFYLPGRNGRIFHKFNKMVKSRKIKVCYIETNEIHDRVFIKNDSEAILLGTSLGGYGNKLAFVLPIPDEDLSIFNNELERIKSAYQKNPDT